MADDDAILAAQDAAMADLHDPQAPAAGPPADDGPDDERQEAIHEILAELRGDTGDDAAAPEPPPAAGVDEQEEATAPAPEPAAPPAADEQTSAPAARPPEPEPAPAPVAAAPAPRPAQAGLAARFASAPHSLILVHSAFLVILTGVIWLGYGQMASTLAVIRDQFGRGGADGRPTRRAQTSTSAHASLMPRPTPREPVLSVDEGLQYTQTVEQADVLFEKGGFAEAAAAYARALAVMPASWDDGACAYRLGECYARLGDSLRAIPAFERVARSYPNQYKPRALSQLGEAHLKLGAFATARQAFHDLLLLQDRYGDEAKAHVQRAYYRIADCYRLEAAQLEGTGEEGSR